LRSPHSIVSKSDSAVAECASSSVPESTNDLGDAPAACPFINITRVERHEVYLDSVDNAKIYVLLPAKTTLFVKLLYFLK
jgi:hypothetical protein